MGAHGLLNKILACFRRLLHITCFPHIIGAGLEFMTCCVLASRSFASASGLSTLGLSCGKAHRCRGVIALWDENMSQHVFNTVGTHNSFSKLKTKKPVKPKFKPG